MDNFTLPPSPNWHLSNVLNCNDDALLAYGSRNEVVIINAQQDKKYKVSFLNLAHKDKINCVVFSPLTGGFKNCLATCGDDGFVRVWDFQECRILYCHSGHKDGLKVTGLDWSRVDTNRVVSVNDLGSIVCWDLASNTIRRLHTGAKVLPLCLACCPHDKDIVAIGCKAGVTLVVSLKGSGKILHRLRGNEQDVISVSWCPVPYNVIKHKKIGDGGAVAGNEGKDSETAEERERELLLATGGLEKSIFIWRAGSDGRFEVVINLPHSGIGVHNQRKVAYRGSNMVMVWTAVRWVDAYTLLSTSQFGELLSWDLNKIFISDKGCKQKPQPRLLHSKHHKGCFTIACPVIYDVITDWQAEKRMVWTTAMDKHIVKCSLSSAKVTLDIPTLGGAVFSLALSPLDPNRLAIGSSDSKVFIWNMSDVSALDITAYWKKIIGKVMSVCWHPTEENTVAYGTGDGHVGLLDVGSGKLPTLFRLHHRRQVYRVCWAPPLLPLNQPECSGDTQNPPPAPAPPSLMLYSVGDGDIFQFNPEQPDHEPKSLNSAVLNSIDLSLGLQKPLIRSDVVFKADFKLFAVGNENGSVYILDCRTLAMKEVIYPHKKLMNNLEWHPQTVASDNSLSPHQHWLATTCDTIKVYNIPEEGKPELIATLAGHSEKIVGLNWSPHFNARLLSASYDFTVQVWDVVKQTCLGMYSAHNMAVMCALFSPLDPDLVISGSMDTTVQLWHISALDTSVSKPEKKRDRVGNALKERQGAREATELTVDADLESKKKTTRRSTSPSHLSNQSATSLVDKEDYKKRQKGRAVFTVTGSKLVQAKHFEVLHQRWVAANSPPTTSSTSPPTVPEAEADADTPSVSDLGYLDFFADDKAMNRLLLVEESRLTEAKQYPLAQQSALWRGDVSAMVRDAITKKRLSDWLVSLAPLVGFELWEEACEAYVSQLVECGDTSKASTYLLAVNKTHEAVQLLCDYQLFREAVAVAKCRLPADDELTAQVYEKWGDAARLQGSLTLAAHCYLAANKMQTCVDTLARIKDLKSLKMAVTLAQQIGRTEQAHSLAVECLTMAVVAGNLAVGQQLIADAPQYQHWSVWLRASELLGRVKKRSEAEVFGWLDGKPGLLPLVQELEAVCSPIIPVYQKLLPHLPTNKTPEFERDMWSCVSGHLAAAVAAKLEATPALFLRHVVSALSAAFHFQTSHPASLSVPLTLTLLAPQGLFSKGSMFTAEYETNEEKQLLKSMKAFACASIILWMTNNWEKVSNLLDKGEKTSMEKNDEKSVKEPLTTKMVWLPELLACCSAEVLDSDNVSFFVKTAQKQELLNVISKENVKRKIETDNKNKALNGEAVVKNPKSLTNGKTSEEIVPGNGDAKEVTRVVEAQTARNEKSNEKSADENKDKDIKIEIVNDSTNKSSNFEGGSDSTSQKNKENTKEAKSTFPVSTEEAKEPISDHHVSSSEIPTLSNGSANHTENKLDVSKLKEIKELDEVLQKFELERVSVPNPFTAYMNIKYLIEHVVRPHDAARATILQQTCDQLWTKSHQ